jgi:hypothetical protein
MTLPTSGYKLLRKVPNLATPRGKTRFHGIGGAFRDLSTQTSD